MHNTHYILEVNEYSKEIKKPVYRTQRCDIEVLMEKDRITWVHLEKVFVIILFY